MNMADILVVAVIVAAAFAYIVVKVRKAMRDKTCAGCSAGCACKQNDKSGLTEITPRSGACPACNGAGMVGKSNMGE